MLEYVAYDNCLLTTLPRNEGGFFMLKKRDVLDTPQLYELMTDPDVFPYVSSKANSCDEFYFLTKQIMEAEEHGELISRTILDELFNPIGIISLFDIKQRTGFLATWIGKPYFGKGYNKIAKNEFLYELFYQMQIDTVFIKVRHHNLRSLHAVAKLPFIKIGNLLYPHVFEQVNAEYPNPIFHLYVIEKLDFLHHFQTQNGETAI